MVYEFKGKKIKIPDEDIKNYMKTLDLTEEEAIETWLDDEGYTENEEVEALTQKAKDNHTNIIHAGQDVRERKKREKVDREDTVKEDMIKTIAEVMKQYGQVEITNKTKIVMIKGLDGETYKIDLIRQRQPKK